SAAAGLRPAAFHPVAPRWLPRNQADVRAAWEGAMPDMPGVTARLEAASYRGRPIFFSVLAPWTEPARMVTPQARTVGDRIVAISIVIAVAVVVAAALLARRHLRTG